MRPLLYLTILKAKRYMKKHNMPNRLVITDEMLKESIEKKSKTDYNCLTAPEKYVKGVNVEKVDLANCTAWYFSLDKNPKDKVLYYIHGGGFHEGSTRGAISFMSYVVRKWGYNVFSIDYRLAPDFKCLDAVGDCEDGYKYLLNTYKAKNIILMGESAGGNLVLTLPQKLKEDNIEMPGAIIASSPVVQFVHYAYSYYECSGVTDFGIMLGINDIIEYYRGDLPWDHHYLSPLTGDLSGYPSVLLNASNCESLRDEARMMYVRLLEEGCDVEYHELKDFFHAMLPAHQWGFVRREMYPDIIKFINRVYNS